MAGVKVELEVCPTCGHHTQRPVRELYETYRDYLAAVASAREAVAVINTQHTRNS